MTMKQVGIPRIVIVLLFSFLGTAGLTRADWLAYRGDAQRSGHTSSALAADLALAWVHRAPHSPQPAWPRSDRMAFDRAYQMVAAGDRTFYGSSADGTVQALDLDTGQVVWKFSTEGPVRFAPAVWQDRLFVASDDGFLYALRSEDGHVLWKVRGGPDHRMTLGNERLISKWPARGGPVVVDDRVYFAAGIWPSEGIYLYALDAATGRVVWCNDDSGGMYMPQPHGGANANSGIAAQGYLAVAGDLLLVPTGRAVPAAFDRHTGKFAYFHLQRYGQDGGAELTATGPLFFNSGHAFLAENGDKVFRVGPGRLVAGPDRFVLSSAKGLEVGTVEATETVDRRGSPTPTYVLRSAQTFADGTSATALIVAGDEAICGRDGRLEVIPLEGPQAGKPRFSAEVEGAVCGLAVSSGCLLATTDRGVIYAFQPTRPGRLTVPQEMPVVTVERTSDPYGQAAEAILRQSEMTVGYCVDLNCGDGRLAEQLALRSDLMIYAVDSDPAMVHAARQRLTAAGLWGSRVMVQQRDPTDTGYPSYFADIIVSGRSVAEGTDIVPRDESARLQRPYGGVLAIGHPEELRVQRRDELAGAGSWTHQYADAANTLCSGDTLASGPLGMQWFRDVDFDLPNRHGRAPSPLYDRGRLFHQGLDGIVAVDAYNGRELWRYSIPGVLKAYDGDELMGTAGTGGNLCVHGDTVYVRDGARCLRLDAASGRMLGELTPPQRSDGQTCTWGYLAAADGIVFGTEANDQHVVTYRYVASTGDMSRLLTESHRLFAFDAKSGDLLWQYQAEHSIRHNAIAVTGGRVLLIDRPLAMFDRQKKPESKEHPTGRLLALDARTGRLVWQCDKDIYGTTLAASSEHGVLLMGYQPTRFRLDSEFGGRLAAFRLEDGQRLWDIPAKYESRPLINGDVVYAQGGAWKLLTGEPVPFDFARSYACGILAASQKMMVFRSATLGYFEFGRGQLENYGGIRPGCWINAIPAGGLVLVPDASSGCRCSYLNQAWIALRPAGE
ncbi:MAG: PQQ-binding-like beta-propeller repeat protein [Pirellulaceae bacterium]|nr:PQQ-binding-like beta-propeller repeat protein [Pirellulaceae bacterium]